ncbi:MAG: hypothetical protein K6A67_04285 [Bacteroidales bacterium]|nr:hypothetical protein [Bacteroidales bacterium]
MRTTAIKYQDCNQNEVLLATSDTLFPKHFLQKKRQSEFSEFRSAHDVSPYNQPFTFTGKEWCKSQWLAQRGSERGISETGYGYFGARYYDSDLSGPLRLNPQSEVLCGARLTSPQDLFILSVDPMSDKYPGISSYAYCEWNPVKLMDIDGKETVSPPWLLIKGIS